MITLIAISLLKCFLLFLMFRLGYRIGKEDREISCHTTTTITNNIPIKTINDNSNSNSNSYKCDSNGNRIYDACDITHSKSQSNFLYKMEYYLNDIYSNYDKNLIKKFYSEYEDKLKPRSVISQVFQQLGHPGTDVKAEIILSQQETLDIKGSLKLKNPIDNCETLYLTRTGLKEGMPNKCAAIVRVPEGYSSPYIQSIRYGYSAKLNDSYQNDYNHDFTYLEEKNLLPGMLAGLNDAINDFKKKLGNPIDSNNNRRSVIVMVANEGVMDLVLNLLCSCQEKVGLRSKIDTSNMVFFVGQKEYIPLLESLGAHAIHTESIGSLPKKAADNYGDLTFARFMWLKAISVYIASKAGFHVLFQDVDMVWIQDPMELLNNEIKNDNIDIVFMDDGARTPRFAPFFVNSGFYYQKYNEKTQYLMEKMLKSVSEIGATHSHQATFIRYIAETHHLYGLNIKVVEREMFPSGIMYHHEKKYIEKMLNYTIIPKVFHMCWTSSREDKVKFFKELGLWFLPENSICLSGSEMIEYSSSSSNNIQQLCCQVGNYWLKQNNNH